ncbi:Chymotrypsin-like elastase family member 2A [Orchesella cincta]|uniref:Chymotrypsin-like elastase family member 2A n=1 Tax=Orchesella cincta TaxID=48709 RepID=A0A1D2MNH7_ORCCI|nr:Chymotrypsin-like elastase family member 2A [Orchesella cincta]
MKNFILVSIGLCALFVDSAVSQCSQELCLAPHWMCNKAVPDYPHSVPSSNKDTACTGDSGPGTLLWQGQSWELRKTNILIKSISELGACVAAQFTTKNWIISAAHCVRYGNDPNNYTSKAGQFRWQPGSEVQQAFVIAGTSHVKDADVPEANRYPIDKVIWHEKWNPNEIGDGYDIVLLHLKRPLDLAKGKIQPMRLEPANYVPNYGGNGVVIGFGNVNEQLGQASDDLMEIVGPIHHPATGIQMSFDPLNAEPSGTDLKAMHLAIGGGDSGVIVGQGDSGGPFICGDKNNKPILCGIASFKSCAPFKFCRKPSYFQRVAPMLQWIKDNTNNEPQEEELFFDEPLFPSKVSNEKAPASLVRIIHNKVSCMGVIVTSKMILTTAACTKNPDLSKANPIIYHFNSGEVLPYNGGGTHPDFTPDVSKNVSHYLTQPLNRNDFAFVAIKTPVPAAYVAKLAPQGYQMKGRSVEYTFNQAVNSLEKRNFLEMDKTDCASKLRAVDKKLELTPDQLCMRQVYSAEKDCKRDLGGLLMCDNGKFFCGLGSFHACKANGFPEIFANYLTGRGTLRAMLDRTMQQNP